MSAAAAGADIRFKRNKSKTTPSRAAVLHACHPSTWEAEVHPKSSLPVPFKAGTETSKTIARVFERSHSFIRRNFHPCEVFLKS